MHHLYRTTRLRYVPSSTQALGWLRPFSPIFRFWKILELLRRGEPPKTLVLHLPVAPVCSSFSAGPQWGVQHRVSVRWLHVKSF